MNIKLYKEGNKKNPAILFLHGFPYDHRMWKPQIKILRDNFYCISYDILEKFEKTKKPEPIPFEFLVDDLFRIIEKENLGKLIVCGLSLGGYIILRALERKPDLFSKIILCDTKTEADSNEGKLKRVEGFQKINSSGIQKYLKEFANNTLSEFTRKAYPDIYKKALKIAKTRTETSTKLILLAVMGRTDTTSVLKKITVPTLVICGEYDTLTPPDYMEKLSSEILQGEFVKVPNAGHLAPFENPKFVTPKILEFLTK
jgi:3-oxoadipate enol-lactonase